ncbi:hypothetical protein I5M32_13380 [Pedobacter sp. SD-b]|uniref:CCDC81-like prokaryotic HU domain-containing protein n=1 Tax=Pedobacter segetis TaxID=2793069 RepID=A0ABS1BM36_9SPHI|nr:hypothetical protein [Pedobacter segetis]MBK0383955.1 hypothetical protein [Pedobacter segetis]
MDITPYFSALLNQKDQIIVPGLGRFFKKRTAGFYDEESKSFYPPINKIDFSTDYLHDDKLVHLISQNGNISLTSAYAMLDEYVREIKNLLKTDDIEINGIGKLSSHSGKLKLESAVAKSLNKSFFGLPDIDTQSPLLIGQEEETYSLAQQAMITAMPADFVEEREPRSIWSMILMILAVAIIAGAIGLYFAKPDFYKNLITNIQTIDFNIKPKKATNPVVINANKEDLQRADSIMNSKGNDDIENKLKADGFDVEKPRDSTDVSIKPKVEPKKGEFRYEIIIGLYMTKEEAQERVKQLKSYQINAYILDDKDGPMVKISGATLYNNDDAEKELKRIRKEINPEAFKKAYKILK